VRNGEVPLSRNPRIPGPSDVEARVSYPLALYITHKKAGAPCFTQLPGGHTMKCREVAQQRRC
jgi:hypothetical protein